MTTAIREAQRLRLTLDPATSVRLAWVQPIDAAPYLAMAQFAAPDAILAMPAPDSRLPYAIAITPAPSRKHSAGTSRLLWQNLMR